MHMRRVIVYRRRETSGSFFGLALSLFFSAARSSASSAKVTPVSLGSFAPIHNYEAPQRLRGEGMICRPTVHVVDRVWLSSAVRVRRGLLQQTHTQQAPVPSRVVDSLVMLDSVLSRDGRNTRTSYQLSMAGAVVDKAASGKLSRIIFCRNPRTKKAEKRC